MKKTELFRFEKPYKPGRGQNSYRTVGYRFARVQRFGQDDHEGPYSDLRFTIRIDHSVPYQGSCAVDVWDKQRHQWNALFSLPGELMAKTIDEVEAQLWPVVEAIL